MKIKSIKLKILLSSAASLIVLGLIIVLYSASISKKIAITNAKDKIDLQSHNFALKIQNEFDAAFNINRTISAQFSKVNGKSGNYAIKRESLDKMIEAILTENEQLIGVWSDWVPGKYDNRDVEFINITDNTGRVISYFARAGDKVNKGEVTSYEDELTASYYAIPAKTLKETLVEPYFFPIEGKDVLMVSTGAPVIVNGIFSGVSGTDISIDFIQGLADEADIYDKNGKLAIISDGGIISGFTGNPKSCGKRADSIIKGFKAIKDVIASGKDYVEIINDTLFVASPIKVGKTDLKWFVLITIPTDIVTAKEDAAIRINILVAILLILISLFIIWFIAGNIAKPLTKLSVAAEKIAVGELNVDLAVNTKDEISILSNSFAKMKYSIEAMLSETNALSKNALNGELSYRADSTKMEGAFKELTNNLNSILDAIITPLNISAEYIDRISKGDIPLKITDEYKGDFNDIKNNLNSTIDVMNSLLNNTRDLIDSAKNGELHNRADASIFVGRWNTLVEGINELIETIVKPLNVTADYIDQISNGIIPPSITEEYKGDFNEIKSNLNQLIATLTKFTVEIETMYKAQEKGDIDAYINETQFSGIYGKLSIGVNNLVKSQIDGTLKILNTIQAYSQNNFDHILEEMPGKRKIANDYLNKLRNDFVNLIEEINDIVYNISEGDLSYRGMPDKHQGTYKKIISDFNNTLDLLIKPLNITAEYIDRISKGDLPPIQTDDARGDFNHIKNNINVLIESLRKFINEMTNMSQKHDEGEIDVIMNSSSYMGAFAQMASGVNQMVNGHIKVILDAIEIINAYGSGDFDKKMYDLPSKKAILTSSINNIRTNLINFSAELRGLILSAQNGELEKRGDATQFQGGWHELVDGINSIMDSVVTPINEAGEVLAVMAQGKLTVRMEGNYSGEFDTFKNDINMLGESLTQLINQIYEAVDATNAAASEISSTAEMLAAAAQQQNSQADEVASAVEEMARTVSENAMGATKTSSVAKDNAEVAGDGGKVVQSTVQKMNDISKVVEQSADNIQKLGESSKAIGEIISVIDDIADQTNLLALNAAIEAARAGEQGRGFAVVADEVRKLAERTTDATKQIASMIKGIQKDTDIAVVAMNQGTKEVKTGIDLADNAGNALQKILHSSNELTDMITQIAAASEEQAATTEEISKNVVGISQATAESARQIEIVAGTAIDLAKSTQYLQELMSKFDVGNSSSKLLGGGRKLLN